MAQSASARATVPDPLSPRSPLEIALAHTVDAVITADAEHRVTYLNAAAEHHTGTRLADALGQPLNRVLAIVDTTTGAAVDAALAAAHGGESEPALGTAVLLGAAERPIVIEYHIVGLHDAHGTFGGTITLFRDVVRRRTAEVALQASEQILLANAAALFEEKERAQVTLRSIGDAVISTDFRGRVTYLNVIAETLTGWTQAEAAGRLPEEIFFLVDATRREHVPCPAMRAVIENDTVRLESPCSLIQRNGGERAVEVSASPIHDKNDGVVGAVMVAHDVTLARDLSAKLARLALYDNLTGLANRQLLADRLDHALAQAQRYESWVSVLFIDLDHFKPVNDTLGHSIGDQLLRAVAARLESCVRVSDTVSRYGGDEFIIVLVDITHPADATDCARKILLQLTAPFDVNGHRIEISASIGIANSMPGASDSTTILKHADSAMYRAKSSGRNNYAVHAPAEPAEPA